MVTVIYGIPLTVLVSCAWALAPIKQRRVRVSVLILLLLAGAFFVAWWDARGHGQGAAAVVAPAVLLAVVRLLIDVFSIIDTRNARGRVSDRSNEAT